MGKLLPKVMVRVMVRVMVMMMVMVMVSVMVVFLALVMDLMMLMEKAFSLDDMVEIVISPVVRGMPLPRHCLCNLASISLFQIYSNS